MSIAVQRRHSGWPTRPGVEVRNGETSRNRVGWSERPLLAAYRSFARSLSYRCGCPSLLVTITCKSQVRPRTKANVTIQLQWNRGMRGMTIRIADRGMIRHWCLLSQSGGRVDSERTSSVPPQQCQQVDIILALLLAFASTTTIQGAVG